MRLAARAPWARRPPVPAAAPLRRTTLNHVDGPLPVSTRAVRFGWTLTGECAVDTVQVVVAATPERARAGYGDVWDSGRRTLDRVDFSDVCLTAPIGPRPGEIPAALEDTRWWSVRVGSRGDGGWTYDWSEPAPLQLSATAPGGPTALRPVAEVTGTLPCTGPWPAGEESMFRWLCCQGSAAVWPLLCSVDLAPRIGGWLERLRASLHPYDPRGEELYATLVEAADLCYDDPLLRSEHAPTVTALRQRRAPVGAVEHATVGGVGSVGDVMGPTLADLMVPLLATPTPTGALPVGVIVGEVAGLRPTAPGWRRFRAEPCLLPQATRVDATVQTPRGPVMVRLRRHPETLVHASVTIDVPAGAVATLYLPWSGEEVVLDAGSFVFVND